MGLRLLSFDYAVVYACTCTALLADYLSGRLLRPHLHRPHNTPALSTLSGPRIPRNLEEKGPARWTGLLRELQDIIITSAMALQFIDQSPGRIGRSDRRIIRSHVMRGKNTGKQRRSTTKHEDPTESKRPIPGPGYVLPRQVLWSDLCLTSFPRELDSESTGLMHRCMLPSLFGGSSTSLFVSDAGVAGFFDISDALFPPQFCTKFDIIKSIWVNCILADEACEWQYYQRVGSCNTFDHQGRRFP